MKRHTWFFIALLISALTLVGCGDDDGSGTTTTDTGSSSSSGDTGSSSGDTGSSSGDTGSSSGDTGSSSGDMGTDMTDVVERTVCDDYCDTIETNCTGANAQYTDRDECMTTCATLPEGMDGDTAGDSAYCRLYHGGDPATADPAFHCLHAGPDGGGVCVEAGPTPCDRFCGNAIENCAGDYQIYENVAACTATCLNYATTGDFGDDSGDTIQCRDRYAQLAVDDAILCLLAAEDGGGVCVDDTASHRIDRVGRPAINTALIDAGHKDIFNFASPGEASFFKAEIEAFLLAIDNIDGDATNGLAVAAFSDHATLAGALADDVLLYNAGTSACTDGFLALELGVADNCGGRTLEQDVMDVILQNLIDAGAPPTTVVTDAVDADDATVSVEFPYLVAPN